MPKRRPDVVILLDILTALVYGPKAPTRLAQTCNLSYDNLVRFVARLESSRLVERRAEEGRELFAITPEGLGVQRDFTQVLLKLGMGRV